MKRVQLELMFSQCCFRSRQTPTCCCEEHFIITDEFPDFVWLLFYLTECLRLSDNNSTGVCFDVEISQVATPAPAHLGHGRGCGKRTGLHLVHRWWRSCSLLTDLPVEHTSLQQSTCGPAAKRQREFIHVTINISMHKWMHITDQLSSNTQVVKGSI